MLHEYRSYTIYPHLFARYCALVEQKAIPIRKDDYGRLVAFWASEAGTLCQVHHIWEYPGVNERNAERARMFQNLDWTSEFIAGAWPTMRDQKVRFMYPTTDITVPTGSNVYETRVYRTVVGKFREIATALVERPRGETSTLVGIYLSESPEPNEVVEITAYGAYEQRLKANLESGAQRAWLADYGEMILDIDATTLLPLPMSPMK